MLATVKPCSFVANAGRVEKRNAEATVAKARTLKSGVPFIESPSERT
jgi:hypothetical protein